MSPRRTTFLLLFALAYKFIFPFWTLYVLEYLFRYLDVFFGLVFDLLAKIRGTNFFFHVKL